MKNLTRVIVSSLTFVMLTAMSVSQVHAAIHVSTQAAAANASANRSAVKAWWLAQGRIIVRSNSFFRQSEDQLKAGEVDTARSLLQSAEAEAEHSMQAATVKVPRGWSDVSTKIRASSGKFKEAMADLLELLGGGNQSLGQKGVTANAEANQAAEDATRLARAHFESLGGGANDLPVDRANVCGTIRFTG